MSPLIVCFVLSFFSVFYKTFAFINGKTKECIPPCLMIEDCWITLDACVNVNVTRVCVSVCISTSVVNMKERKKLLRLGSKLKLNILLYRQRRCLKRQESPTSAKSALPPCPLGWHLEIRVSHVVTIIVNPFFFLFF